MTKGVRGYIIHSASNRKVEDIETKDAAPLPKEEMPWILMPYVDQNYLTNRRQN